MELEYKDSPIRPATNPADARRHLADYQRRQRSREEMERKARLDAADRRIEELRRELRALGEEV